MFKNLIKASAIYGIGPEIPKLINFIMLPIITPFLSPEDYGYYGIIMAYLAILALLKDLGLSVIVNNVFFKYKRRYLFTWSRVYGLLILWDLMLAVIIAGILYLVFPKSQIHNYPFVALLYSIPIGFFSSTILMGRKHYHLNRKPIPYVSISIISSVLLIVSNFVTIVIFQLGYLGWFISFFVGQLSTFIQYSYVVFKKLRLFPSFAFNWKWVKRQLSISLPVIPHFYSNYLISTSDRIVLDYYKIPIDQVGLYTLGYNWGNYFNILGVALGFAAGPIFLKYYSRESKESDKSIKNLTLLTLVCFLILGFIASIWMKEFFQLLIRNESLSSAYVYSIFIIMSFSIRPMYLVPSLKLQYIEKTMRLWKISFVAGVINVIFNLIFVPIYGVWSAVWATFISMAYMGISGYLLKEYRKNNEGKFEIYPIIFVLLAIIGSFLAYFIVEFSILLKVLITAGVFLCVFLSRGQFKKLKIKII